MSPLQNLIHSFASEHVCSVWLTVRLGVTGSEWQPIGEAALPAQEVPSVLTVQIWSACAAQDWCAHRLHTDAFRGDGKSTPKSVDASYITTIASSASIYYSHSYSSVEKVWIPTEAQIILKWEVIFISVGTWCCKCYYESIKFSRLHTGTSPSGAGFKNSCSSSLFFFGSCVFMTNEMQITYFSNVLHACTLGIKRWLTVHYLSL